MTQSLQLHLYPTKLLYTIFSIPHCSVYCNVILANLNARMYFWGESMLGTCVDSIAFNLDFHAASSSSRPVVTDSTNKQFPEPCLASSLNQVGFHASC